MASTATHLPEVNESPASIASKAIRIAGIIAASKGCIVFTGAGISTSAGIPDFRGPTGVWTLRDKGLPPATGTPVARARPSYTHLALKALVDAGLVKAVISQNTDGLHARSGVPLDRLLELHGNSYQAVCWKCGYRQLYREQVRGGAHPHASCKSCLKRVPHFCHCTSYACPTCGPRTPLRTTIINFRENLDASILGPAERWAETADACLALGSSLTVTPAAGIPERIAERGGSLVIVNKQDTPLDGVAKLRVQAPVDAVMAAVMSHLGVAVPEWDEGACWAAHAGELGALTTEAEIARAAKAKAALVAPSVAARGSGGSLTATAARGSGVPPWQRGVPAPAQAGATPATAPRVTAVTSGTFPAGGAPAGAASGAPASGAARRSEAAATQRGVVTPRGSASVGSHSSRSIPDSVLVAGAGTLRALSDEYARLGLS